MTATKRIPGLNIVGTIVPCDERDTYATHDSQYGKGGWHEVATLAERDAIPVERRRIGMVVFVKEDYTNYQLKQTISNDGWVAFATPDQDGTLTEAIKQMEKRVDILNEKVLDVEEDFDQKADIYYVDGKVTEINTVIETLETKEDAAKHATKEELAEYLKKAEAEETYATKEELNLKADKSALSAYATKVELDTYVSDVEIQAYAKKTDLAEYAKTIDVDEKLEEYAKKSELDEFTTEDEVKAIVDAYIDPDELTGVLSNYVKVETLTANLANYVLKTEMQAAIKALNVEQYVDETELQAALDGLNLDKYIDATELKAAIDGLNLDKYIDEAELQKAIEDVTAKVSAVYATKTYVDNLDKNNVKWVDSVDPDGVARKLVYMDNHQAIVGKGTDGTSHILAMLSKYNVADFGSGKAHTNLNTQQIVTVNDTQAVVTDALMERIVVEGNGATITKKAAKDPATGFAFNMYEVGVDTNIVATKEDLQIVLYPLVIDTIEANGPYEVGSSANVTVTWAYNKDIVSQSINGISLDPSVREFTFEGVTENTTYVLEATDEIKTVSNAVSVEFLPSCYWGASEKETLTNEDILALNSELLPTKEQFRILDCSGGKYFYFVIRQDLCENIIFKVNGIMFNSLEEEIIDLTNASGNTDKYILYRSTDMQTGTKIPVEVI